MKLKFYTKRYCPLCDDIRVILETSRQDWEEVDIEEHPEVFNLYRYEIPVVERGSERWFYRDRIRNPLKAWLLTPSSQGSP